MNRNGKRLKGFWFAALLLVLGAMTFQGNPAEAFLTDAGGEVDLGFTDDQGGELPKHPGGDGGNGPGDPGTRRADPDDLSFNNPRVDAPVVASPVSTPPAPGRPGWAEMIRFWLERLVAQFILLHR
jgi:hypothetical protein